ncbi:MAG: FadR family transcriptional regulator [Desulfovibrionaceae bacterium]|nr:FadR family transcriptional regulator [Desulfovibrionaceae bacterium]
MSNGSEQFALGKRRGLPEELASIIISRIEGGDFKLGDVLPSEQALADMYKVSRTVVREALARLKYEGIILSKRGSGPVVCSTIALKSLDMDITMAAEESLSEFFEFRLLLEGEASALAAIRHTEADAAALKGYLDQMRRALDEKTSGAEPDYRFHGLIAEAAANEYIANFTKDLSSKIWMRVYSARDLFNQVQEIARIVLDEHTALYEAIIAREPHRAKAAAQKHILCSAKRQGVQVDTRHLPLDTQHLRCGEALKKYVGK